MNDVTTFGLLLMVLGLLTLLLMLARQMFWMGGKGRTARDVVEDEMVRWLGLFVVMVGMVVALMGQALIRC